MVGWNGLAPNPMNEVIGVLDITGVTGGDRPNEMVNIFGDLIGFRITVRYDRSSGGHKGVGPGFTRFVDFGQKIKSAGRTLVEVWEKKFILLGRNEMLGFKKA